MWAKLTSFDLMIFFVKKVTKLQKLCFDKNTFCSIFPVLIDLQTCTIPHFKGNFILNDLSFHHGWATVASGTARDENVSLLTFGTPSSLSKQKKIWSNHPIYRNIQLQNFQCRNPSNF